MLRMLILALVFMGPPSLEAVEPDYGGYDAALKAHVDDGWVDYKGLRRSPAGLNSFLAQASTVGRQEFDAWGPAAKKAFLINLYNAATLRLVLDHYPVKSIKEIGGVFKGPWKQPVVPLFGAKATLDHVEHEMLRKMGDPRIHFAIVCASKGCPRLISEAYRPKDLDAQLDQAAKVFLHEKGKNEIEPGRVCFSPLFKWFKGDFVAKAGSLEAFVGPYLSAEERAAVTKAAGRYDYFGYDWTLNERGR